MPIIIKEGNLLDTTCKHIAHQVNCRGVMGSGVAKAIRQKYPEVYRKYVGLCNEYLASKLIGSAIPCRTSTDKVIWNLFAQDNYGYGKQYTNYNAFQRCLANIVQWFPKSDPACIAMPYMIGCGRGGGDWNIIYPMIEHYLGEDFTVELWKYNEK